VSLNMLRNSGYETCTFSASPWTSASSLTPCRFQQ
jgi:hypothetical protein